MSNKMKTYTDFYKSGLFYDWKMWYIYYGFIYNLDINIYAKPEYSQELIHEIFHILRSTMSKEEQEHEINKLILES